MANNSENSKAKRPYTAPTITDYGSVTELTLTAAHNIRRRDAGSPTPYTTSG